MVNEPSGKYLPVHTVFAETVPGSSVEYSGNEKELPYTPIVPAEPPTRLYCDTPGCAVAASKMLGYIDESQDPCENFYNFACGQYRMNFPFPLPPFLDHCYYSQ